MCFEQGVVTVGAVDCDSEANKALCAKYQVQGFPTIKVRRHCDLDLSHGDVLRLALLGM